MKIICYFAFFSMVLTACTPRIQLETPEEGITINMNVVVEHKIDVQMDEKSRAVIQILDKNEAKSEKE